jgi:hypothetical protein
MFNTDPEVVPASIPHVRAISEHVRHQSRTKVSSEINRIASFPATVQRGTALAPHIQKTLRSRHDLQASTNSKDDKEQSQRNKISGSKIPVVFERVDQEHQDRAGDEFGEELASLGHEGCWVGAKNACCRRFGITRHRTDVGPSFEDINGGLVVGIHHPRST